MSCIDPPPPPKLLHTHTIPSTITHTIPQPSTHTQSPNHPHTISPPHTHLQVFPSILHSLGFYPSGHQHSWDQCLLSSITSHVHIIPPFFIVTSGFLLSQATKNKTTRLRFKKKILQKSTQECLLKCVSLNLHILIISLAPHWFLNLECLPDIEERCTNEHFLSYITFYTLIFVVAFFLKHSFTRFWNEFLIFFSLLWPKGLLFTTF